MLNTINLAVAFDRNYLTPIYVLLTSIFRNNSNTPFRFFVIATGLTAQEEDDIRSYITGHNSSIEYLRIREEQYANLIIPAESHFTAATYFRLFIPSLLPADVTRLLFLDADTIVISELATLYNQDLGNYAIAAVPELSATRNRPDLGVFEEGWYFNAGVMLINVQQWKDQRVMERSLDFIIKHPSIIRYADQDGLNASLYKNYKRLPTRFNIINTDVPVRLMKRDYRRFLEDKVIIHYTLMRSKPWNLLNKSKLRFLYYYYHRLSPRKHESVYIDADVNIYTLHKFLKIRTIEIFINNPRAARILSRIIRKDLTRLT